MAEPPTPDEAEAAMLRGFRNRPVPVVVQEAGPAVQLAVCPRCSHEFEVLPAIVPIRVTE